MADDLRGLRLTKQLAAKDMVAVIQELYPSFDKTMLSKSENGEKYGVILRRDAMNALIERFAPEDQEAIKKRRRGGHRLTCKATCRLEDDDYALLQRLISDAGYDTTQDWLSDLVKLQISNYLQNSKGEN